MKTYTTEDARNIVMKCAKLYEQNLNNKKFLVIYKGRIQNTIRHLELIFLKNNYQHLTGIELIDDCGKVRKNVFELFYAKCLNNTLKKVKLFLKTRVQQI